MAKAVDKAYHTVRERIVRGVYPASSRITEQEVAAVAGVSRTPVREALRKLHAEGRARSRSFNPRPCRAEPNAPWGLPLLMP